MPVGNVVLVGSKVSAAVGVAVEVLQAPVRLAASSARRKALVR